MLKIIHHPTCSKCLGLLEYLQVNQIPYEHRDYMQAPLSYAELSDVLVLLKLAPLDIIRQNEPLFLQQFAGVEKTGPEWIQVLADYPELLERPIIITGAQAIIGRPLNKALAFVSTLNQ